jgi:hypothetical protein
MDGWRYPFDLPEEGYVLHAGNVCHSSSLDLDGREPVLAIGSNGAPERLLAKFGSDTTIPVTPQCITDWAIVYSAHVSRYGAVPATMHPVKGASSQVFVTWLTDDQRARMDETEGLGRNYSHDMVSVGGIGHLAYVSIAGALGHRGGPIRLAEVAAIGGPPFRLYQTAMLEFVARLTGLAMTAVAFSQRLREDNGLRAEVNAMLAERSLKPSDRNPELRL